MNSLKSVHSLELTDGSHLVQTADLGVCGPWKLATVALWACRVMLGSRGTGGGSAELTKSGRLQGAAVWLVFWEAWQMHIREDLSCQRRGY